MRHQRLMTHRRAAARRWADANRRVQIMTAYRSTPAIAAVLIAAAGLVFDGGTGTLRRRRAPPSPPVRSVAPLAARRVASSSAPSPGMPAGERPSVPRSAGSAARHVAPRPGPTAPATDRRDVLLFQERCHDA